MILSGGKEGKYDTMVQKLEKRYVKKSSYTYVRVYDPDQTGLKYHLQNNMIAKLISYQGGSPLFLKTKDFIKPYDLSLNNVFQSSAYGNLKPLSNEENEKEFEKIYFLFSCIYPFYLAKYGYNLENNANVFVGPYVVKRNKTDVEIEVNYNRKGMMTFAMETSYVKTSQDGGKPLAPPLPPRHKVKIKTDKEEAEKKREANKDYKEDMEKRFNEVLKEMDKMKGMFGKLREQKENTVSIGNQLSAIQQQMDELRDGQPLNNGEEEGKKKLYTIFSQTSFDVWKTKRDMVIMVTAFLKADHDTRVRMIQGTFFNNPVSETLKVFLEPEEGKKKKTPPLLLKHFFGYPDKIKSSAVDQYRNVIEKATPQMVGKGPSSAKKIRFSVKNKTKKSFFRKIRKKRGKTRRNKPKRQNKIRKTKKNI
jgi:hypothetical protein